ncbi:MAG: hypothetical protein ISS33_04335 [Candidatus Omnitrophica bacterium]|nr:hypothetical protein [Candidatus Omnitrophota bacterium]
MKRVLLVVMIVLFVCAGIVCDADEIKGRVTAIDVAAGTIDISGVKISVKNADIVDRFDAPITLTALVAGDYLEVEGSFTGAGQMMAMDVEKSFSKQGEIKGRVESVDEGGKKLVISGITVEIQPNAVIEGHDDALITIDKFAAGNYVECKGNWSGPSKFSASKVELD